MRVDDPAVTPMMRACLELNRRGKLHPVQRRELIIDPLVRVLILSVPVILLLRSVLFSLLLGPGILLLLGGILLLLGWMGWLRRQANRQQIYVARWHLTRAMRLSKGVDFADQDGQTIRFRHNLAPRIPLRQGERYLVYYFKDGERRTLLSLAPLDHPDIDSFEPTRKLTP
jgi:hypothetical protein